MHFLHKLEYSMENVNQFWKLVILKTLLYVNKQAKLCFIGYP